MNYDTGDTGGEGARDMRFRYTRHYEEVEKEREIVDEIVVAITPSTGDSRQTFHCRRIWHAISLACCWTMNKKSIQWKAASYFFTILIEVGRDNMEMSVMFLRMI